MIVDSTFQKIDHGDKDVRAVFGYQQDSGYKIFYAYFLLAKNTRIEKMKIFTISVEDEGKF
jgi:hypothetical protein